MFWTAKTTGFPKKKSQVILPHHSKKQEKMTPKSTEKIYEYSEMSLIEMSRQK